MPFPIRFSCKTLDHHGNRFSLSGECPFCECSSAFLIVGDAHVEPIARDVQRLCAVMQCQGCRRYLLGIVRKTTLPEFFHEAHFPQGSPKDQVPEEIPEHIASDLKEALRCRFVDAHNATVEMCRRAVQASCIHLQAPPDQKLVKQIDWLASNGVITAPLQQMAHRIRLGGNLGAHPPEDPDNPDEIVIGSEYADAVIEFTNDFFQHVYVIPERLRRYTFKKSPAGAKGQ